MQGGELGMSLFPFLDVEEVQEIKDKSQSIPCEFDYDFIHNKLKDNLVYGKDAIKVWIYKALLTKRYKYLIYTWDYGHEIEDLVGKNYNHDLISAEMKRFVEECLSINPYILSVDNFECKFEGKKLSCDFTVHTQFGEVIINELSDIRRTY